mmetsp:Transcript_33865/g.118472  ORF Transcript_33865/g.118472 Transcript_33865/m.118472 type:complete len:253 (-) Transcript_33865:1550-2308(-)
MHPAEPAPLHRMPGLRGRLRRSRAATAGAAQRAAAHGHRAAAVASSVAARAAPGPRGAGRAAALLPAVPAAGRIEPTLCEGPPTGGAAAERRFRRQGERAAPSVARGVCAVRWGPRRRDDAGHGPPLRWYAARAHDDDRRGSASRQTPIRPLRTARPQAARRRPPAEGRRRDREGRWRGGPAAARVVCRFAAGRRRRVPRAAEPAGRIARGEPGERRGRGWRGFRARPPSGRRRRRQVVRRRRTGRRGASRF